MQDKHLFSSQSAIRQHCLDLRGNIPIEQYRAASQSVCDQIINSKHYQQAQHIAAYLSIGKEINLQQLIQQARMASKRVYLPRVTGQSIIFAEYTGADDLVKSALGILEPRTGGCTIDLSSIDVMYLPLVAFDPQGHRIGMGGGYYDRYLSKAIDASSPVRIGVAHPEQCVENCLPNPWDVPLHSVIQAR